MSLTYADVLQEMSSIRTGHWACTIQYPLTNMAPSVFTEPQPSRLRYTAATFSWCAQLCFSLKWRVEILSVISKGLFLFYASIFLCIYSQRVYMKIHKRVQVSVLYNKLFTFFDITWLWLKRENFHCKTEQWASALKVNRWQMDEHEAAGSSFSCCLC